MEQGSCQMRIRLDKWGIFSPSNSGSHTHKVVDSWGVCRISFEAYDNHPCPLSWCHPSLHYSSCCKSSCFWVTGAAQDASDSIGYLSNRCLPQILLVQSLCLASEGWSGTWEQTWLHQSPHRSSILSDAWRTFTRIQHGRLENHWCLPSLSRLDGRLGPTSKNKTNIEMQPLPHDRTKSTRQALQGMDEWPLVSCYICRSPNWSHCCQVPVTTQHHGRRWACWSHQWNASIWIAHPWQSANRSEEVCHFRCETVQGTDSTSSWSSCLPPTLSYPTFCKFSPRHVGQWCSSCPGSAETELPGGLCSPSVEYRSGWVGCQGCQLMSNQGPCWELVVNFFHHPIRNSWKFEWEYQCRFQGRRQDHQRNQNSNRRDVWE